MVVPQKVTITINVMFRSELFNLLTSKVITSDQGLLSPYNTNAHRGVENKEVIAIGRFGVSFYMLNQQYCMLI